MCRKIYVYVSVHIFLNCHLMGTPQYQWAQKSFRFWSLSNILDCKEWGQVDKHVTEITICRESRLGSTICSWMSIYEIHELCSPYKEKKKITVRACKWLLHHRNRKWPKPNEDVPKSQGAPRKGLCFTNQGQYEQQRKWRQGWIVICDVTQRGLKKSTENWIKR